MTTRRGTAFRLAMIAASLMAGLAVWPTVTVRGDEPAAQTKGTPAKGDKESAKPAPPKPKIAVFRLAGDVTELPPDETFSFGAIGGTSLRELLERIKKAGEDPNVKAVVFLHEGGSVGMGQAEELRGAMAKVRAAGKEIYAHADSLSMREYVLLSGASRLSVVPTADLWIIGLFGESPYLRGLLDKLGVKPEFLTCGSYKSAAEIFLRDGPSPEAEAMQNWLLDGIFETSLALIAQAEASRSGQGPPLDRRRAVHGREGRGGRADRRRRAPPGLRGHAEIQVRPGRRLRQEVRAEATAHASTSPRRSPCSSSGASCSARVRRRAPAKHAVGIVYVEGPITLGGGQASLFGDATATASKVRKALDEAAGTTRSRRSSCGSIRRAGRPSPARSSSTPPGA